MTNDMNSNYNRQFGSAYVGMGYAIVRTSTASTAIPIEGATVIIRGSEPENQNVMYSLLTDRDGLTPRVSLPAPLKESSQSSGQIKPFAVYSIEVYKEGYYPQFYQNVPIFDGITAVQPAQVIPLSDNGHSNPYVIDEQIFGEKENPLL